MDYKKIINDYKNVFLILIVILAVFIFLLTKIIPSFSQLANSEKNYVNATKSIEDMKRQLQDLKAQEKQKEEDLEKQKEQELSKPFFKSIDRGMDTESVIANEFAEVLVIIRANSVKTKSIEYEYDPKDDNFLKNAPGNYNVARLKLQMIGSYKNFESFLKELFKHEHFIDIESIEIVPYEKNRRILLVNLSIKLYAQKS